MRAVAVRASSLRLASINSVAIVAACAARSARRSGVSTWPTVIVDISLRSRCTAVRTRASNSGVAE